MTTSHETFFTSPRLLGLGWDEAHAEAFSRTPAGLVPGRVIARHRGRYRVAGPQADTAAILAGRLRRGAVDEADLPAVGDWVALSPAAADGTAAIHRVLPRRTAFRRRRPGTEAGAQVIAANVDLALIAAALTAPVNPRRLERYLALAWESGAVPLIVLTKRDLCDDPAPALDAATAASPGVDAFAVSTHTGEGLERLRAALRPRRTAVILGPSGVGKSTLTNALLGQERLRTAAARADGRGRHTTTHRELIRLENGALLIDTPGLREVGLWDADEGVRAAFEDIDTLAEACRFRDCRHAGEPGCAVAAAVEAGALDADRVASWHRLVRELDHLARRRDRTAATEEKARTRAAQRAFREHVRRKRGR